MNFYTFIRLIPGTLEEIWFQTILTFFVLNHVALFPEENWPQEIVVNGSVLMAGKKMSKSMGNIIPLRACSEKIWC